MVDVTVVVPTIGRAPLLELALRSALRQRGVMVDVVVVADGPAADVDAATGWLGDRRVRVLRHDRRRGVSAARNTGMAAADAGWVAFLDDDDLWAPDKLSRQLAAAEGAGRAWAYADAVVIDAGNRVLRSEPPVTPDQLAALLHRRNVVPAGASNVVVRRTALEAAGPFDTTRRSTEDWDLFLRLLAGGPPAYAPEPLVAVRVHPEQVSIDPAGLEAELASLERRHGIVVDRAAVHRHNAWACLRAGQRRNAGLQYGRAALAGDRGALLRLPTVLLPPAWLRRVVERREEPAPVPAAQAWVDVLVSG